MKSITSILLFAIVLFYFSNEVEGGMTCAEVLGYPLTCPMPFQDNDRAFCCYKNDLPYCCEIGEFIVNNTGIIAGIAVSAIIILLLCTLCCCCCCSCCLLAKRRQRTTYGHITIVPPTAAYPATSYPLQPATTHSPPPAYPTDSNLAYNPHYSQPPKY